MARLGIMIEGQEGLTWERWHRIARLVEDLGYESLWRSDHFFSLFGPPERESLETFESLTTLARETRRIRFGPLVTSITFRHPSLLARMAAAVDVLSGGRLELGMGAGWHEGEHRAFGLPFPPPRQRMEMLEEGIQVVRALWTGERVDFQGKHYRLENAASRPVPVQRPAPPIIVGGSGEKRLLRIVARHADEWNVTAMRPDTYRHKRAVLERHCEELGRDPATIRRSWMGGFLVAESAEALERRARRLQEILPPLARVSGEALPAALQARGWLVGRPDEVAGQIRALEEAGVQRFMLQLHDQEDMDLVELVAREVMPAVGG
jgi:F420-dependent oxidoreductase-like protein